MQKIKILFILALTTLLHYNAIGETHKEHFTYKDAITLGIVQGFTEFLPISSTGHLIFTDHLLDLDQPTPITGKNGDELMIDDQPYTLSDAANGYAIVIQGGTILAVVFLYWKNIISMIIGVLGRDPNGRKLARNLIIAFIPAAIVGLLLHKAIEFYLFNNKWVMIALITGSVLIFIQNRFKRATYTDFSKLDIHELTVRQSLFIGLMQCLALWPGMSRSLMTILGGYWTGLNLKKSAEFSFLLGLVTLTAASLYKVATEGREIVQALSLGPTLLGCITAFIIGALSIKWLVGYLTNHGLVIFAWYRIALGVAICLFFL